MAGVDPKAAVEAEAVDDLTMIARASGIPRGSAPETGLPEMGAATGLAEMGAGMVLAPIALSLTSHGDPVGTINGIFMLTPVLQITGGALRKDLSFVGVDTTKIGLFPPSQFPAFSQ